MPGSRSVSCGMVCSNGSRASGTQSAGKCSSITSLESISKDILGEASVNQPAGNVAVRRVTVRGSAGAQATKYIGAQVAGRTAFVEVAQWKANGKDAAGEVVGIFKKHL